MNKIIKKYNRPGKWEVVVPFEKIGEERSWVGIIDGRQAGEYDLRVVAEHRVKQTKGRITVKAVVGKGATVKIFGRIVIAKEAQESDSFLQLRVLMLDKTAKAIATPELMIAANNVQASHGASIGQIDSVQLLYLMSRGLSKNKAIDIVIDGFLMIQ